MSLEEAFAKIKNKFDFRKEVDISDMKFELGILTLKEEQSLNAITVEDEDSNEGAIDYFNKTRKQVLSHAIKKVNGEEVPDIVKVKNGEKEETKEKAVFLRDMLDRIPSKIIEHLFEIYVDLREEADEKIDKSVQYNWFKTPEVREKERQKRAASEEKSPEKEEEESVTEEDKKEAEEIKLKKIDEPPEEEPSNK